MEGERNKERSLILLSILNIDMFLLYFKPIYHGGLWGYSAFTKAVMARMTKDHIIS